MGFEHSIVNMLLFPSGLLGGGFSAMDYLVWNEIPTVLRHLVGGLTFVGLTMYAAHAHARTGASAPNRRRRRIASRSCERRPASQDRSNAA